MNRRPVFRAATLVSYFGLLALLIAWIGWLSPPRYLPTSIALLLVVTPLLVPMRGLLHGRPLTHVWTGFLALLYFVGALVEAIASDADRPLALLAVVLSLALYTCSQLYARYELRARRLEQGQPTG